MKPERGWEIWTQRVAVEHFSDSEARYACSKTLYARMRIHGYVAVTDFDCRSTVDDGIVYHEYSVVTERYKHV